jgi:anti-sigma B factor antagonist
MSGSSGRRDGRLLLALAYDADVASVTLAGELDLAHVRRFDAVVAAAFMRADRCRIDLAGVRFIDSSGIRALLRARRRASEGGVALELANARPTVSLLLATAGLEHLLSGAAPLH